MVTLCLCNTVKVEHSKLVKLYLLIIIKMLASVASMAQQGHDTAALKLFVCGSKRFLYLSSHRLSQHHVLKSVLNLL